MSRENEEEEVHTYIERSRKSRKKERKKGRRSREIKN
jgi:hypothetical protein